MSVNILRLRVRSEFHPRSKNGAPPHRTTGAASASCSQAEAGDISNSCSQPDPSMPPMLMTSRGMVRPAPIQKRRRMLRNSLSSSAEAEAETMRGSSAIPHLGQLPGLSETTSGCIGHVYSVLAAEVSSSSKAIPHLGHEPGLLELTSGSIAVLVTWSVLRITTRFTQN